MNKKLIVVVLVVIILSAMAVFVFKPKDTNNSSKIVISELVAEGEGKIFGTLSVEGDKIVYEQEKPSNLDKYIEKRIPEWESGELDYDNGGYTNGVHSTSTKGTQIGDEDFMNAIYIELEDNWDGFSFDLVEAE